MPNRNLDRQKVIMCNDVVEAVLPYGISQEDAEEVLVNLKMTDKQRYMELQGLTRAEDAGRQYNDTHYWRVVSAPVAAKTKSKRVNQIIVQFPMLVEISDRWEQSFFKLVQEVADHHNEVHPAQVMWLFGIGDVHSSQVFAASMKGEPLPESDGTLLLEFSARDRYMITDAPTLETLKVKARQIARSILPEEITDKEGVLNLGAANKRWELEDTLAELVYETFAVGRIDGRGEEVAKALARAVMRETSATVAPGALPIGIHLMLAMLLDRLPNREAIITHEELEIYMGRVVKVIAGHDAQQHHVVIKLQDTPQVGNEPGEVDGK